MRTPKTLAQIGTGLALGLMIPCVTVLAQEARFFRVAGPVTTTIIDFTQDGTVTWTNEPINATFTVQTTTNLTDWVDWVQVPATNATTIHRIFDPNPPARMAFIPAGSFTMGNSHNSMNPSEGEPDELPLHTVYVSAIYMDKYEVTKALWDEVYQWATNHGYNFSNLGSWYNDVDYSKGPNHPVHLINWFDVVKWCNARSEKEGRTPAYYTNGAQTIVYRTGQVDLQNDWVKWDANGYRLPTEAEWEKAARGGLSGQRFPFGDTISHSQANYLAGWNYNYDFSYPTGYHPAYFTSDQPYTSPVGSFASNGYGLHDMAGNVFEWCWDWYSHMYYNLSLANDPHGPTTSGGRRVVRGAGWGNHATTCRVADRDLAPLVYRRYDIGFRCVRGL